MVFYDIKDDSFTCDWQGTQDGGTTWNLLWRIILYPSTINTITCLHNSRGILHQHNHLRLVLNHRAY